MLEETTFKINFLKTLNKINKGWIDGDKEPGDNKKADIINHQLKIAIEIKDDTIYKIIPDGVVHQNSLKLMNERFSDHLKSANNKFRNYPGYKTIVLFRTEYIPKTVKYAIEGLDQYRKIGDNLYYSGKVGKYSKFTKHEVGGFLIVNDVYNEKYYFPNWLAKQERVIENEKIKFLTGWLIKDLK